MSESTVLLDERPKKKTRIIAEKILWKGGIIRIKVPLGAYPYIYSRSPDDCTGTMSFSNVAGQHVYFHVFNADKTIRGKTITARVSVLSRILSDQHSFLSIGLDIVPEDTPVTHVLIIAKTAEVVCDTSNYRTFITPSPGKAIIVVAPPNTTLASLRIPARVIQKMAAAENPQIEELQFSGWSISRREAKEVILVKGRKTVTLPRYK